jgi:hypothetical protein
MFGTILTYSLDEPYISKYIVQQVLESWPAIGALTKLCCLLGILLNNFFQSVINVRIIGFSKDLRSVFFMISITLCQYWDHVFLKINTLFILLESLTFLSIKFNKS